MSTLKVTHLQNENGTGPAMSIAVGGGVTFAGITTFHDAIGVAAGATIGGSTNTITASTNGEERLRIDSSGDIEIAQGKNLTWVYEGGSTHRARIRAESTDALIFENGLGNTEQLRITSAGNVGINDTDPNFKLDVNGDIGIREGNNLVWHDASGTAAFRIRAQSDNILRFERASGNEPNLTIDDGKIGIGDTQPERKLDVVDSGSSGAVVRSKVTTNNGGYLAYEALNSSGTSVFSVTHNGRINLSENIVFASGQGLDFSATADATGMSSELLDDYEEGYWFPYISGSTSGSVTGFTERMGTYTKIGNRVMVEFYLANPGTNSGVSGYWRIDGLPYVASSLPNQGYGTNYYGGGASHWDRGVPYTDFLSFSIPQSATNYAIVINGRSGTTESSFITSSITGNLLVRGSMSYITT